MTLSFKDVFIPIIEFLVLGISYEHGSNRIKEKRKKKMDIMKPKDNIN